LELSLIDLRPESQLRQVDGYSLALGTALMRTTLHFRLASRIAKLGYALRKPVLSQHRDRLIPAQRSPYHSFQGNEGCKDKGNDPGESDGEEDVVHGDQGLLFDVNSITRRAANRAILLAFTPWPMTGHSLRVAATS
jgi:hypothetical protein